VQSGSQAGINQAVWSTRLGGGRGARAGGAPAAGPVSANPIDQWAPLGDYNVTVTVADKTLTQTAKIAKTQGWSMGIRPEIIR
jgi:hypothetical protein